jgi:hypothetical protein
MSRRSKAMGVLAFLVVAGVVGASCGGSTHSTSAPGTSARRAAPAAPSAKGVGLALGAARVDEGIGANASAVVAALGPKIVKTAQVSLQLRSGTFAGQFQQVSLVAARHGGYVADSQTSEGKLRSGTVVIRVPVDQFEVALAELRGLGTLRSERIAGQDVTGQVVDLQARLRNWEAQETVLLRLMRKSATIDDSIKVQRQIQDVQLNIEEIRGELHTLADQTDLSTITLSMAETAIAKPVPAHPSALARAWHQAISGSVAVVVAIVVGAGYLFPFAVLGFAFALGWLVLRRRRVAPGSAPATPAA